MQQDLCASDYSLPQVNKYYASLPVMNLSSQAEVLLLLPFIVKGGISIDIKFKILPYAADKNFMFEVLSLYPKFFQYASAEIRDDFKIALMVLTADGSQYGFASDRLKSHRILAYHAVKGINEITDLALEFRSDVEIVAEFVAKDGRRYKSISQEMRNEERVFMAAVSNYPYLYHNSKIDGLEYSHMNVSSGLIPEKFFTKKYALQVLEILITKNPPVLKKYGAYNYFIPDVHGVCSHEGNILYW